MSLQPLQVFSFRTSKRTGLEREKNPPQNWHALKASDVLHQLGDDEAHDGCDGGCEDESDSDNDSLPLGHDGDDSMMLVVMVAVMVTTIMLTSSMCKP